MDFIIDPLTGDLDFGEDNSKGLQIHVDPALEAAQRVNQAISLNIAEWFADVTKGLPYIRNPEESVAENLRYFFGSKSPNAPIFIYNSLTKYIRELDFVSSVTATYTFDNRTRIFTYSPQIKILDGTELTFPSLDINL